MSGPVAGNHNDLYEIETSINELFEVLENAHIAIEGLFINADAGYCGAALMRKVFSRPAKKKALFPMLPSTNGMEPNHASTY